MRGRQKTNVCLVIPAYNEGEVIYDIVKDLNKHFKKSPYSYNIVVVDDGSRDNTVSEARRAGATVIEHIINTGSGGATATGLSYAYQKGFDIATTSDADGQHSPEDVLRGVKAIESGNSDLLIGSRLLVRGDMSKLKTLGNKGLTVITYILFGITVTDSQSGLRIFSKRALEKLKWRTSGYEFCSEMLWRAKQLDLKISEFPIKSIYTEYSMGKGQNNWNGFNIVTILVRRRIVEFFGE